MGASGRGEDVRADGVEGSGGDGNGGDGTAGGRGVLAAVHDGDRVRADRVRVVPAGIGSRCGYGGWSATGCGLGEGRGDRQLRFGKTRAITGPLGRCPVEPIHRPHIREVDPAPTMTNTVTAVSASNTAMMEMRQPWPVSSADRRGPGWGPGSGHWSGRAVTLRPLDMATAVALRLAAPRVTMATFGVGGLGAWPRTAARIPIASIADNTAGADTAGVATAGADTAGVATLIAATVVVWGPGSVVPAVAMVVELGGSGSGGAVVRIRRRPGCAGWPLVRGRERLGRSRSRRI